MRMQQDHWYISFIHVQRRRENWGEGWGCVNIQVTEQAAKTVCLGRREQVVCPQEQEELRFLLPVSDVLAVAAPERPVVRLRGNATPLHLKQKEILFSVADPCGFVMPIRGFSCSYGERRNNLTKLLQWSSGRYQQWDSRGMYAVVGIINRFIFKGSG